jgi:hypothetical protein
MSSLKIGYEVEKNLAGKSVPWKLGCTGLHVMKYRRIDAHEYG